MIFLILFIVLLSIFFGFSMSLRIIIKILYKTNMIGDSSGLFEDFSDQPFTITDANAYDHMPQRFYRR